MVAGEAADAGEPKVGVVGIAAEVGGVAGGVATATGCEAGGAAGAGVTMAADVDPAKPLIRVASASIVSR